MALVNRTKESYINRRYFEKDGCSILREIAAVYRPKVSQFSAVRIDEFKAYQSVKKLK